MRANYLTKELCQQVLLQKQHLQNTANLGYIRYIGMVQDINSEIEYVAMTQTTNGGKDDNGGGDQCMYEEQQCMFLKPVLPVEYIRGYDYSDANFNQENTNSKSDHAVNGSHKRARTCLAPQQQGHENSNLFEEQCSIMVLFRDSVTGIGPHSKRKPRLNDLVEIFGTLDFVEEEIDPNTNETNRILPRVSATSFERLDLDIYKASLPNASSFGSNRWRVFDYGEDDRSVVIEAFAHHLFCGNTLAAEALMLALLSKAERMDNNEFCNPIKMSNNASVGCAALNFVLPNDVDCAAFGRLLHRALEQMFPCVSPVDLSVDNLNNGLLCPPYKQDECVRMKDSCLQLVKGSVLLLNNRTCIGMNNMSRGLNVTGQSSVRAMTSIASTQSVLYSFGSYCQCKFDADYRTIILSCSRSYDLIPSTLKIKVKGAFETYSDPTAKQIFPPHLASKLRTYFTRCQSIKNIGISKALCLKAEQEFVERRKLARSEGSTQNLNEDDFHRWLTLTRLQARSRGNGCVTHETILEDWELALQIDDAMKSTFSSSQVSPMKA